MIRRAARPDRNFLIVDNAVVRDSRLSLKATGLLVRILSRPDDWRMDRDSLARECKEGTAAIRSALKELRGAGYIVQGKRRDEKGHWITETVVYDRPQVSVQVTPEAGNRPPDNRPPGSPPLYIEPDLDPDEDVLECPAPPSSVRAPQKFEDWRAEDRALFKSIIGDTMTSNGSTWNKGTYTADAWYDGLHKHKTRPMKWPGRFVQALQDRDGLYEYFTEYGIEPAA